MVKRQLQFSGGGESKKLEVELENATGKLILPNDITLKQFSDSWFPYRAKSKKWTPKTFDWYNSLLKNYILPFLGEYEIQGITKFDVDMWIDKLRETEKGTFKNGIRIKPETQKWSVLSGEKKPKFLSENLIGKTRDFLVDIFNGAVEAGVIKESPVEKVRKEKLPPAKAFWDEETMYSALQEISDSLLHLAVHLTIIGTLRTGEACGILTEHIHLQKGTLDIKKVVQRVSTDSLKTVSASTIDLVFPPAQPAQHSRLVLKGPKNKSSIKTIFLTQPLILEIFERLKTIETNKKRMGEEYHDYGLLICQKNGDPIEPNLLGHWFQKWQKSVDNKYPALSFKGLRHSSTTYKFGLSGGDVTTVQAELGDATAKMVTDVYAAHTQDKRRQRLMSTFQNDFYQQKDQTEESPNQIMDSILSDPELRKKLLIALLAEEVPDSKH